MIAEMILNSQLTKLKIYTRNNTSSLHELQNQFNNIIIELSDYMDLSIYSFYYQIKKIK